MTDEQTRVVREQLAMVRHTMAAMDADALQLDEIEQLRIIQERLTDLVQSATRRLASSWSAADTDHDWLAHQDRN